MSTMCSMVLSNSLLGKADHTLLFLGIDRGKISPNIRRECSSY